MVEAKDKIQEAIRVAANQSADLTERLQNIFLEEFDLLNKSEEKAPDAGYRAWGLAGVDVGVRLAKIFIGLQKNTGMYEAVCDLTYQLNSSDFWQKNAAVLMPLIHAALNAHRDGAMLLADRVVSDEYGANDTLIRAARAAPLEIFGVLAYLVGGPQLMAAKSLSLKQRLAPYFL